MVKERDFKRGELLGKYIAKMLYRQDNRKFETKYLKKLKRNWQNGSQFLWRRNLEEEGNVSYTSPPVQKTTSPW